MKRTLEVVKPVRRMIINWVASRPYIPECRPKGGVVYRWFDKYDIGKKTALISQKTYIQRLSD